MTENYQEYFYEENVAAKKVTCGNPVLIKRERTEFHFYLYRKCNFKLFFFYFISLVVNKNACHVIH